MKTLRKISPVEATHLAKDNLPDGQFVNQFFIEGEFNDGKHAFDEVAWQQAIAKASAANPFITAKLIGHWGFRYWQCTDRPPTLKVFAGHWDGRSSSGFEQVAPFINPRTDSTASVVLVNRMDNENKTAGVLFRIHHGLCDGAATAHWIQEVFRALRGETLSGSVSTLSEKDVVKAVDYPKPTVFRGRCLPVFAKSQQPDTWGCHWIRCHWDLFDERIVAKLLYVLRTLAREQHGQGRTVFRLSADLRHHLLAEQLQSAQLSNISGIFDLEVNDNDSVKKIQFNIIKALRNKQDLSVYPKRMLSLTPWVPGSIFNIKAEYAADLHRRGLCNISAMIGYANRIDLNAVSCAGFTATGTFAIPMPLYDKSVFLGVASTPNGIDVIISAPNALSTIPDTLQLAEQIEQGLKKL